MIQRLVYAMENDESFEHYAVQVALVREPGHLEGPVLDQGHRR